MRSIAMNVAGAVVAPMAMAASALLPHPVIPHAIAAPRRVLSSSGFGCISYYEDGAAGGSPVLLLHDLAPAGATADLRALFEEIRFARAIVAPDLPGHGHSQGRSEPFERGDYVRFVEEMLVDVSRRFGATIDVVAIGATCELAAEAVVRSSRHVRSLTLIAPTGFAPRRSLERKALALLSRDLFPRLARWSRAAQRAAVHDVDVVANVYDELRVPTCFVHGTNDAVPRGDLDLLAVGHATFVQKEIGGASRAPHADRPDATADALRAFWRTLSAKPELRLIRGEKSDRGAVPLRRGAARAARRRSWT